MAKEAAAVAARKRFEKIRDLAQGTDPLLPPATVLFLLARIPSSSDDIRDAKAEAIKAVEERVRLLKEERKAKEKAEAEAAEAEGGGGFPPPVPPAPAPKPAWVSDFAAEALMDEELDAFTGVDLEAWAAYGGGAQGDAAAPQATDAVYASVLERGRRLVASLKVTGAWLD